MIKKRQTLKLFYMQRVLSTSNDVFIRSPSGDTIFVITLSTITQRSRVKFDYGNGSNRKKIWLDQINLRVDRRLALIGFHSFTGNDCVSTLSQGQGCVLENDDKE